MQVDKNRLQTEQDVVTDATTIVDDAAKWSTELWNKTYLGMGDTQEAAMYRAAQRYGIEPGTFWSLRYRKPKDILASVYFKLKAAYEHECQRQEARLRHELELVRALPSTATREALIREAEAALGTAEGRTGTEG